MHRSTRRPDSRTSRWANRTDRMLRTQDTTRGAASAATQRESDHQRWADDGGRSPEPEDNNLPQPADPRPHTPARLPVRLVYRRLAAA
jgi:hypothetical protein